MPKHSHAVMRFSGTCLLAAIAFTSGGCSHPMDLATTPGSANVRAGDTLQFTASINGATTSAVTWTATVGTISATGLSTAPGAVPTPNTATIQAVSSSNASVTASSTDDVAESDSCGVVRQPVDDRRGHVYTDRHRIKVCVGRAGDVRKHGTNHSIQLGHGTDGIGNGDIGAGRERDRDSGES